MLRAPFLLLHFTSSLFSMWMGNLKGLPALFLIYVLLSAATTSFSLLSSSYIGKNHSYAGRSYLFLEYLQSLHSTYVSFNSVIVQYSHWRGAVRTSHATEFQFHGNHQSFSLLGWMFASLSARVTRPWMWTLKEEGVPVNVARWGTGLQNSEPPSNWSLDLSLLILFFPLLLPTPIGTTLTHPWITPFSHSSSNSSDIHGNQARVRTSTTKRSAHESPWKDLTFYILRISVCGCLHRKREVGKLWWTGPCSSTIILVQSLHFWFHSKSTCLVGLSWLFRNTGALASFCLLNNVSSIS